MVFPLRGLQEPFLYFFESTPISCLEQEVLVNLCLAVCGMLRPECPCGFPLLPVPSALLEVKLGSLLEEINYDLQVF